MQTDFLIHYLKILWGYGGGSEEVHDMFKGVNHLRFDSYVELAEGVLGERLDS
jgi:hypothetical protein